MQKQPPEISATGKWMAIPRQMTVGGKLLTFDMRYHMMDTEVISKGCKPKANKSAAVSSASKTSSNTMSVTKQETATTQTAAKEKPVIHLFIGKDIEPRDVKENAIAV